MIRKSAIGVAAGVAALFIGTSVMAQHGHDEHGHSTEHRASTTQPAAEAGALQTPSAIRVEHEHLHHELDAALSAGGKTAEAAKGVRDVLAPHFEQEEAYAMPPLGLLQTIAQGKPVPDAQAQQAIKMADRLRAEYDQMLAEHGQITDALKALASAAKSENKPEQVAFAEGLMLHAQNEEQVLYPTTLLIGEYLKLRQAHGAAHQ